MHLFYCLALLVFLPFLAPAQTNGGGINHKAVLEAQKLFGVACTAEKSAVMRPSLREQLRN